VGNQDNIWDLIGAEDCFRDDNRNKKDIFKTGLNKQDLLNLEKRQLQESA